MGFIRRATLSLEQRVAKHKEEFSELSKDLGAAIEAQDVVVNAAIMRKAELVRLSDEHHGA